MANWPSGTSFQNVWHYRQELFSTEFIAYDWGSASLNRQHYGVPVPPAYNLTNIVKPHIHIFYGDRDKFIVVPDARRTISRFRPGVVTSYRVTSFGHTDFVWSINAHSSVYKNVIQILNQVGNDLL